jgi:hypothetical protein
MKVKSLLKSNCYFFPEYKERLKKAPLCAGKKQLDEKA